MYEYGTFLFWNNDLFIHSFMFSCNYLYLIIIYLYGFPYSYVMIFKQIYRKKSNKY